MHAARPPNVLMYNTLYYVQIISYYYVNNLYSVHNLYYVQVMVYRLYLFNTFTNNNTFDLIVNSSFHFYLFSLAFFNHRCWLFVSKGVVSHDITNLSDLILSVFVFQFDIDLFRQVFSFSLKRYIQG